MSVFSSLQPLLFWVTVGKFPELSHRVAVHRAVSLPLFGHQKVTCAEYVIFLMLESLTPILSFLQRNVF